MSDLDARCFVLRNGALFPADFAAEEFIAGIPNGKEVLVTIRRPRSPQHHRWFFAMLRKVSDNSDNWGDEDDLLDDLKHAVGHVERRQNILTGETLARARSISFASMGQDAFNRFVNRCLFVLAQFLGISPDDLKSEVDASQSPRLPAPSIAADPPPQDHQQERVRGDERQLADVGRGRE